MATLLSNPASPPAAQSEQAELKVLWEDEMKAVNKYVHYKNVFALLLFWENKPGWTDMSTEKEVNRLEDLLRDVYKFQVQKQMFRETRVHVQAQMNKYLSDFIHEFGHEDDTMLIIYYAGHGWALPGGRGELQLAGKTDLNMTKKQKEQLSIDWNRSEHIIQNTKADILLILDCCNSGTLSHHDRFHNRRFELLAACGHDKTTSFPGRYSFTSALIWALDQLAKESPFSTCKLRLKIKEAPLFAENSPFPESQAQDPVLCSRYQNSNRLASDEHIMIEVLGQGTEESSETTDMPCSDDKRGDYVDFRFHFAGNFDEDELKTTAREMKNLTRKNELSLRHIAFLRKGNVVQQAASAFLDVARRRKGSPGLANPLTQNGPKDVFGIPKTSPEPSVPASPNERRPFASTLYRGVANATANEESPLLPTQIDDTRDRLQSPSIRYHFRELLKGILALCLEWLRQHKSPETTPKSEHSSPELR